MKKISQCLLLFILLFSACNQEKETSEVSTSSEKEITDEDEEKLLFLIRSMYEWHETKSTLQDFMPIADADEIAYIGLDKEQHNQRVAELKQSGFFAEEFIENYKKIATSIDEGLNTKKLEWLVGELPDFGNYAGPWCDCQDYPENYWKTMTIKEVIFENNSATFTWTWGDDFEYKGKAILENDQWKISYLQGFDLETYF